MIEKQTIIRKTRDIGDEERWRAVQARDTNFDGLFYYGVRSTSVYCRPTCPSRRPRREQVVFFDGPELAEKAGYRPCKRCRPKSSSPLSELVQRACRFIEANSDGSLTLSALSAEIGISAYHIQRTFKRVMGITPRQYAEACRSEKFKTGLKKGVSVTEALYEAGYGSSS